MSNKWLQKFKRIDDKQVRRPKGRNPVSRGKVIRPTVKQPVVVKPEEPKPIKYYLSDPLTPELVKEVMPPAVPEQPAFKVVGYKGGGHPVGSTEAQAGGVYVTIANGINTVNTFAEGPMIKWSATKQLTIIPRAGRKLNAYYNRSSLAFFFETDPITNQIFFCADSADIVLHELGHAVLDAIRPELWSVVSLESWAFHEAFGDFFAAMNLLNHDEAIDYLLKQTNGNLRTENICSNIAEQFGLTLWNVKKGNGRVSKNYLRCSYNDFKYVEPKTLKKSGLDHELTSEPHNFSRVMSGALYDCFTRIYEANLNAGQVQAIKVARDTILRYVLKGIRHMPNTNRLFASFANTVLWVDHSSPGSPYHNMMWEVFENRRIIDPIKAQSVAIPQTPKLIRVSDFIVSAQNTKLNPLYDLQCLAFEEDVEELVDTLEYLNEKEEVSESPFTAFQICDGKIERTHFSCGCGIRQIAKSSPEYFKRYKPENNAGCGCQQQTNLVEPKKPVVKRGCFTRYRVVR